MAERGHNWGMSGWLKHWLNSESEQYLTTCGLEPNLCYAPIENNDTLKAPVNFTS